MIRAMLAITAGLLCGVAGTRHGRQLTGDASRLRRWEQLLRHLELIMAESALSLPEAFEQAASTHSFPDETLRVLARRMREAPLSQLNELYDGLAIPGQEAAILRRLMNRLGRGSLENRRQAVLQAADEIALLATAAGETAAKDSRMWTTLGWTCGACLTLMLI